MRNRTKQKYLYNPEIVFLRFSLELALGGKILVRFLMKNCGERHSGVEQRSSAELHSTKLSSWTTTAAAPAEELRSTLAGCDLRSVGPMELRWTSRIRRRGAVVDHWDSALPWGSCLTNGNWAQPSVRIVGKFALHTLHETNLRSIIARSWR